MKTFLTLLLLVGIASSADAQIATNVSARFKTRVTCKMDSSSTVTINPSPGTTSAGFESKDMGASPGQEYELAWKFVGRKSDKDAYHFTFTRRTKPGVTSQITTSKDVLFDGHGATIFKDDLHVVTLDSPTE
ncbi:MAG TPA: hypothetical protein VN873_18405 [Candidatus Angelobacter sp.]|nr:hypothetical protein [Candidatus Angelobacter sp.]